MPRLEALIVITGVLLTQRGILGPEQNVCCVNIPCVRIFIGNSGLHYKTNYMTKIPDDGVQLSEGRMYRSYGETAARVTISPNTEWTLGSGQQRECNKRTRIEQQ